MSQDPELSPEQEAHVARLLSGARANEPIPADVAARLEGVLGELSAERPGTPPMAPVLDLAARRRRRRAGWLLSAAAAVLVVGVGTGIVIRPDAGGDEASSAVDDQSADQKLKRGDSAAEAAPEEAPSPTAAPTSPPSASQIMPRLPAPVRLTPNNLNRQILKLQAEQGIPADASEVKGDAQLTSATNFVCAPARFGPGTLRPVYYLGQPAVLVFAPPVGKTQVVELLRCGSADRLRSTTVPVP